MIEELLERIAVALEENNRLLIDFANADKQPAAKIPTEKPAEEKKPAEATGKMSRQEIKAELDRLNIQYNDRLRTENLEKLLEDAKGQQAKPAPEKPADPFPAAPAATAQPDFLNGDAAPKQKETVYTKEQAVEFAKRLAAKFGADKTVGIIQEFGAQNISQIDEKGQLQQFVEKILAKEKEYEAKK